MSERQSVTDEARRHKREPKVTALPELGIERCKGLEMKNSASSHSRRVFVLVTPSKLNLRYTGYACCEFFHTSKAVSSLLMNSSLLPSFSIKISALALTSAISNVALSPLCFISAACSAKNSS
jgi:hypothetical protein